MALVTTHDLGKSFGLVDVFAGLSLSVPRGARIAVVGPNGIGKTSLLRVIAGKEPPSAGTVHRSRGLTIGYLPQESVFESANTLWDECLIPLAHLLAQQKELTRLEAEMVAGGNDAAVGNAGGAGGIAETGNAAGETAGAGDTAVAGNTGRSVEDTLERYGALQARFEEAGGYTYETRIRQVLTGLGFSPDEYALPLTCLSGGQRTRALLARLLIEKPGLLILDEPTNHLDVSAVEWLESYIRDWDGAVLIVSHDRYLLDKVCNNVWEMSRAGVEAYRGNYSHYLRQRQERWDRRSTEFEAEKARLEKEMDYVKRNIAAQNVAQARGRLKRMSRQIQAIEQIGLDAMRGRKWLNISEDVQTTTGVMTAEEAERRIKSLRNPIHRPKELKFRLAAGQRGGNIVLRTRDLAVGYPGNHLFTVPDIDLQRLGCVALIGPNGSGKTTFLKVILGKLPPLSGEAQVGASLDVGYFAQAHEGLNLDNTLMQEIESVAPRMLVDAIRGYLARYLFTGEDVFKKVQVLSGGERGRLALAKLALSNANLLLLDEPTNHLDIPSQEVLQNVLVDFDGTIILVSHDRFLIDALATQVWEIDRDHAVLKIFEGTYSEYRASGGSPGVSGTAARAPAVGSSAAQGSAAGGSAMRDSITRGPALQGPTSQGPAAPSSAAPRSAADDSHLQKGDAFRKARAAKNREIAEERRALARERRRKARIAELEGRIAILQEEVTRLGGSLADPPSDRAEILRLGEEYMRTESEMEALIAEWENLQG
ncbi:MAG: ABC-F family ATP-binding cassette domain-containing protein [Candidatus Eisenbacteria bacterium]|nr:ABC-F family ATP-binding cassette domain-containing protein [Candidatus Eisenbacteria bacterium]